MRGNAKWGLRSGGSQCEVNQEQCQFTGGFDIWVRLRELIQDFVFMLQGKYCECTTFTHTETTRGQMLHSSTSSYYSSKQQPNADLVKDGAGPKRTSQQLHDISAELTPTAVLICHKPTNHKSATLNKIYNTKNMETVFFSSQTIYKCTYFCSISFTIVSVLMNWAGFWFKDILPIVTIVH